MSHGPVEKKHDDTMNAVAGMLNEVFEGYGFALLVFNQNSHDGRINYIGNCDRENIVTAMKEFIANHEARVPPVSAALQ